MTYTIYVLHLYHCWNASDDINIIGVKRNHTVYKTSNDINMDVAWYVTVSILIIKAK